MLEHWSDIQLVIVISLVDNRFTHLFVSFTVVSLSRGGPIKETAVSILSTLCCKQSSFASMCLRSRALFAHPFLEFSRLIMTAAWNIIYAGLAALITEIFTYIYIDKSVAPRARHLGSMSRRGATPWSSSDPLMRSSERTHTKQEYILVPSSHCFMPERPCIQVARRQHSTVRRSHNQFWASILFQVYTYYAQYDVVGGQWQYNVFPCLAAASQMWAP